jgi:DNA-binding transcriptional LysR family regulator
MDKPEMLGDIAIFAAVVREGSFTRAADKLELSTSQVSKCVNRSSARWAPGCSTALRAGCG